MSICYIYALVDPRTSETRYIGKTTNLKLRFNNHVDRRERLSPHKQAWINQLKEVGLKPVMIVLEETTLENWKKRERYWQLHFENLGADLTNLRACGEGRTDYSMTPEGLEKMRQVLSETISRPDVQQKIKDGLSSRWKENTEYRETMRKAHVGRKNSKETIEKMRIAHLARWKRKHEELGGTVPCMNMTVKFYDRLIDPDGNLVPRFSNFSAFCRERGLNVGHMSSMYHGHKHYNSCKGWTAKPIFDVPGDPTKIIR